MNNEAVTAVGTPNMALIKYWGKRDEKLILPTNTSLSITFDEKLCTKTSVLFSDRLQHDSIYIDGAPVDASKDERLIVLDHMRRLAGTKAKALVVSNSNFPSSSGLASSASGVATLVYTCNAALELGLSEKELSIIARQGSGSSCRSVMGGFVRWNKGAKADGSDSYAEQVAKASHWPELNDMIAIVSREKKKVSSRNAMKQTVETSPLYKARMAYVEDAAKRLTDAIAKKDFASLAEITMRDSNNMHAVILDTYPAINYLNDVSRDIIYAVHELNESEGRTVGGYTFDAGPNGNVLTTDKDVKKVSDMLSGIEGVEEVIRVKLGEGPRLLSESESLIDTGRLAPARNG